MTDWHYINLDHAAGGLCDNDLMLKFAELKTRFPWNPHGVTAFAELSRQEIIRAENRIFATLGLPEAQYRIIWTGTGTEALNLAITGFCQANPQGAIYCSPAAHHGMMRPAENSGRVRWQPDADCALSCAILVNNETGAIEKIDDLPGKILVDACQAVGKIPLSCCCRSIDMMVISGKKLGTPMQIGALILRKDISLTPQILGGGQQNGLRSGTLDAPSCSIVATAVERAIAGQPEFLKTATRLRNLAKNGISALRVPADAPIFFERENQCPGILMFAIPGLEGALIARILAHDHNILVGTGSACSAETGETSHVLKTMAVPDNLARCAVRLSFGSDTTPDHITALTKSLQSTIDNF